MPRDPVCGNYVDADTAYKREMEGVTHHFCSADCADEFEVNYEEYLDVEEQRSAKEQ